MIKKKHFLATLLAATALTTGAAQAAECYNPCNPCDTDSCFGGFEIGAEFLYWKMCTDDLNYATSFSEALPLFSDQTLNEVGTIETIRNEWKPGVRAFISKDNVLADWGIYAGYSWMRNHKIDHLTAPVDGVLQESVGSGNYYLAPLGELGIDSITASYEMTYQTFDALFTSDYCFKQCHNFRPYFGVTGLFLDQTFATSWDKDDVDEVSSGTTHWTDDFSGYGLKVGGEYSFDICDGFSMFANSYGAITVGTHTAHYTQTKTISPISAGDQTISTLALNEHETTLVPGYHVSAGLQYDSCMCDVEYAIRVGYEFVEWRNVPNQRRFFNSEISHLSSSSSPTIATHGYHGLLVGGTVTF